MSFTYTSALADFYDARRRAALEEIIARLTGKSASLLSYHDVIQKLKAGSSESIGLQEIPLDAIVGSVGRYSDFTRHFLPRQDSDEERWARTEMALAQLPALPPIEVYQIGQAFFVLDGNHRVSIARQRGATHIHAYVTRVHIRVPLAPDVRPDDLILKAEYTDFLERTRLDEIRPEADLSVTVPGRYPMLEKHIQFHYDLMSLRKRREIPYQEAIGNWYDKVYLPVVQVIRKQSILRDFPGRTETDLYLWVLEHRDTLEDELGWPIRPEAAAADLAGRFGSRRRRVVARVGEKLLDAVAPGGFEDGPAPGQWRKEQTATRQMDCLFADLLVPVSGQEPGWQALDQAMEVARREGGRLLGLYVVASEAQRSSPTAQAVQDEFYRRCRAAGLPGELVVEVGRVAHRICERARWVDLIVVNLAHPPAPQPVAKLKSGFRMLIRRCSTPVLAVPRAASHLDRALLAYDGSPKAREALFVATYLAARWNIAVDVVSVMDGGHVTPKVLARALEYLETHGVKSIGVEESGPVPDAILRTAQEHAINLIIMGGYGHSPMLEVVLGSAVDQVLRESQSPILICR